MTGEAMPRFIARAGTYAEFERHPRFADPSRPFTFAIAADDMVGANRAEALARSGLSRSAIEGRVGQEVVIVVVDTLKPVADPFGRPCRMSVSKVGWHDLQSSASCDPDFLSLAFARGIELTEIGDLMTAAAGGNSDKAAPEGKVDAMRVAMDRYYGLTELAPNLIAVSANGTGFRLTADNYRMFFLGHLTAEEVSGLGPVSQREVVDRFMLDTSDAARVSIKHVQLDAEGHFVTSELWLHRSSLRWVADTLRACVTRSLPRQTFFESGAELINVFESGPEWDPIVNLGNLSRTVQPPMCHLTMSRSMAGELADALAEVAPPGDLAVVAGARQKWRCKVADLGGAIREDGDLLHLEYWARDEEGVDLRTSVPVERRSLGWLIDALRAQTIGGGGVRRGGAGSDRFEISEYGPERMIALFNHRAASAAHPGRHMLVTSRQGVEVMADSLSRRC